MKAAWPFVIGVFFTFLVFFLPQSTFAQVKLNEIFANPVDENNEFVELFNSTDQPIDITGYSLNDLTNKPFIIPEATISGKSFYSVKTISKFQMNNTSSETIILKDYPGTIIDSFSFEGATENLSFSRFPDGNNWLSDTPTTENLANQAPSSPSPSPGASPSPTPSSSQTAASPAPSSTPTPSPSPSPSPVIRITDIVLLNRETPEPILGASSSQNSARPEVNWQLALMLVTTGAGLLLATTFIMIRSWRKK